MRNVFAFLLCVSQTCLLAQSNCRVTVVDFSDSTPLAGALVELTPKLQIFKKVKVYGDSMGRVELTIPDGMEYDLLIFKEGFKPLFSSFARVPKEIVFYLKPLVYDGEEVMVTATRSGLLNSATYTTLTKKEISLRNFGQDLPILLQNTPSAVSTSDAGAGIGYSGLRIRGIDPSRINVTINGVPLNDAESQGVFWVNMPDFASGVDNIQIQRGVGSSTNGAGAFGASLSLKTDKFSETAYALLSGSYGSFNTHRQSIKLGTGRLANNWYAEGRMSWIRSDGYIDRATSDLHAWNFSMARKTAKSHFQVLAFSGKERTYQAWNGVPMAKYKNDTTAVDSLIKYLYYDSTKAVQLRNSHPNQYNYYTYSNETDNYRQSHVQVIYNRSIRKNASLNLVLHGTLGKGYFENFEKKSDLSLYTDTPYNFYGQNFYHANLINQRWLDNNFSGMVFSYTQKGVNTDHVVGGAANVYRGKHFGEVIWHEFMDLGQDPLRYYDNKSKKTDANIFWKVQYRFSRLLSAYSDLQLRHVNYSWFGPDISSGIVPSVGEKQQQTRFLFFNPKAGIQYQAASNRFLYLTYGRAVHEPIRDDFVNSSLISRPLPEILNNVEAGFKSSHGDYRFSISGFYMGYKNQLALSGKVNDVGGYSRINIPKSYRAGIELELNVDIATWINLDVNMTLSQNKIETFVEHLSDFNTWEQTPLIWKNTDIAFSPNRIVGAQFLVKVSKNMNIVFLTKSVGRQYLDNTQNLSRSLDPYLINDLVINLNLPIKENKKWQCSLLLNNIGNQKYASNGYTYSGIIDKKRNDFVFVYPQAGFNYLLRVELNF